eukprot:maker-scaffold_4-snap-gene-6.0-mRNA-1 protein AED:0.23 eAED:0.23 QI:0/0/0/1/0/0/2/0/787
MADDYDNIPSAEIVQGDIVGREGSFQSTAFVEGGGVDEDSIIENVSVANAVLDTTYHKTVEAEEDWKKVGKNILLDSFERILPGFQESKGSRMTKFKATIPKAKGKYYILSKEWTDKFIEFIFDEKNNVSPGPVDQSPILSREREVLRSYHSFTDKKRVLDFCVVPEAAWSVFMKYFGGGPEFCVEFGASYRYKDNLENCIYTQYVPVVILSSRKMTEMKRVYINKLLSIERAKRIAVSLVENKTYVPYGQIRFHDFYQHKPLCRLDTSKKLKTPLAECDIHPDNMLLVEFPLHIVNDKAIYKIKYEGHYGGFARNTDEYIGSRKPVVAGGVGLKNVGNTCYMNSMIQCLSNVPVLKQYLVSDAYKAEVNTDNPLGYSGKLANALSGLLKMMWTPDSVSMISPDGFKKLIDEIKPEFQGYEQHDSQEFLSQILDGLHEDLNKVKKKPYTENVSADGRPDAVVAKETIERYKLRNDSYVGDLFTGMFKSTVTCPDASCKNVSVTFDPYMILPLPLETAEKHYQVRSVVYIPEKVTADNPIRREFIITPKDGPALLIKEILKKKLGLKNTKELIERSRPSDFVLPLTGLAKPMNFYSALELFSKTEKLNAMNSWYCSECQKFQEAYKQLQIWSLPKVLVVQFKRFSQKGGKSTADKLETPVEFPDSINLTDFVLNSKQKPVEGEDPCFQYELVAVSSHIGGGLGAGHYVSAARNEFDGKWYEYDDHRVDEIAKEKMVEKLSREAYVIFYMNKTLCPDSWFNNVQNSPKAAPPVNVTQMRDEKQSVKSMV